MSLSNESAFAASNATRSSAFSERWRSALPGSALPDDAALNCSYVIDTDSLSRVIDHPDLLLVDLRPREHGAEGYIPGSVHIDYERLIRREGFSEGLLPRVEDIRKVFSELGLQSRHFVVAY
ncbi:MAG: rhodanese-like domain-containing protein, partial [bacterium]